jgi:4-amino-4-deoxy-L-arabinose transferase-like glycosyltransferase
MGVHKQLIVVLILATIVRVFYLLVVPIAEAPDEVTHVWVLSFLVNHARLPLLDDITKAGSVAVYGSLPALGYLPHWAFVEILPKFKLLIAARIGSVLMGLITVAASFYGGKLLFKNDRLLALALPLALAFHPQLVFVQSYTNNDVTATALSALLTVLLIKAIQDGPSFIGPWQFHPRFFDLLIGILSAWLLLSKYSGYAAIITAFIFLGVASYLHRRQWLNVLTHIGTAGAAAVVLSAWYFVRNWQVFNELTGTQTMYRIWAEAYHKSPNYTSPLAIVTQNRWWRMNFFSFWGWFGYMTRSLQRPWYYIYLAFLMAAIYGAARNVLNHMKGKGETVDTKEKAVWAMLWCCFILNWLASVFGSASGVSGPQGRYFFTSEIPLMALLLAGLRLLPGKTGKCAVIAFLVYNFICCMYSAYYLYTLYGFSQLQ